MAAATRTDKPGNAYLHTWALTTADSVGDAVSFPGAPDRCYQAIGADFGGGTVRIEGSLDGNNWFALHDPSVTVIGLTGPGGGAILENPLFIRASLNGSTAGAATVFVLSRSNP